MEEILASIRRILNDDDAPVAHAGGTDPVDDGVLVLDQSMMVAPSDAVFPEPKAAERVDAQPDVNAFGSETEAMPVPPYTDPGKLPPATSDLVAPEAAAAAASSVGSLVRTLAAGRATQVYGGGPTLEDMVRAELRPLLKEWLDVNLPPVVERLVRAEIERVVGRQVP
jgi:cell pole-organizing protein PopZ